ncbi:MAG: PCRF domain-containing protein, partial [Patescibacteria group bacterium]
MEEQKQRLQKLNESLRIDGKKQRIIEIKEKLKNEETWKNWEEGQGLTKELSNLERDIEDYEILELYLNNNESENFEKEIKKLELKTYLSGKHDEGNTILSIHAGQGGTEANDWVEMLLRMYLRYCERKGWKAAEIIKTPGEEAGIKSVVLEIEGKYSYGFLKRESGVHRLVRQSPFNSDSLRQTSFALIEVIPVIENDTELDIKEE